MGVDTDQFALCSDEHVSTLVWKPYLSPLTTKGEGKGTSRMHKIKN